MEKRDKMDSVYFFKNAWESNQLICVTSFSKTYRAKMVNGDGLSAITSIILKTNSGLELDTLYKKYNEKGFEVLDFPCNQFGHQAPGDDKEIHEFCTSKYDTTFDRFAKIDVNGENEDKLFKFLKEKMPNESVTGLKNKTG